MGNAEGAGWVNMVQSGQATLAEVALAILASDEYFALAIRVNGR
jgi:hypothetical protein